MELVIWRISETHYHRTPHNYFFVLAWYVLDAMTAIHPTTSQSFF
jgi:hypothetical protein